MSRPSFLKCTIFAIFCLLSLVTPTLQCNCSCSHSSTTVEVDVPSVVAPVAAPVDVPSVVAPVAAAPIDDVPTVAAPVAAAAVNKSDCSTIAYSMMPCLSYLLTDSTEVTPSQSCCAGIKEVVDYNPHCLCVALEGSRNLGFDVNTSRALASPVMCHLSKTQLTCDATSAPVTPSPAPIASPVKPSPPVESPVKPTPPVESPVESPVTPSPAPVKPTSPVESPVKPSPPPVTPSPEPVVPPVKPTPVIAPSQPPMIKSPASAVNKSDCSTIAYSMMPCLSYLLTDSTEVTPSQSCCAGIKEVVDYNPHCLCVALEGSRNLGFDVNTSRALASPVTCHLSKTEMTCDATSAPVTPSPTPIASPVNPSPPVESPVKPSPPPVKPSPAPVVPTTPVIAPSQPPTMKSPAQVPVPAPSTDCSTVAYGMVDCLSFLTPGSSDLKPPKSCCDAIETVVDYDPRCLCVGIEGSRDLGFTLNNTRAYNMPTICNIAIDPHCKMPASTPQSPVSPSPKPPASVALPRRAGASQPTASAPAPSMSGAMDLTISKSFLVVVLFSFVFNLV